MTLSQRAVEAAARACYEHEPQSHHTREIPWDELGQGTRDRFMHKARATITAALAVDGLCLVQGWQPIETAPKDGTDVLLYSTHQFGTKTPTVCSWWSAERCAENDGGGEPDDYEAGWYSVEETDDGFCWPTHWMQPLALPSASDGEEG